MTTNLELKAATAAVNAQTGRRYCRKCTLFKPFAGGYLGQDARRRPVWYCATCTKIGGRQARPATVAKNQTDSRRPGQRDLSSDLSPAWKLAHAPLNGDSE